MTDFAGTFDRHEINDRRVEPGFGSWRLMRRKASGGLTSVFWCRITAADGLLRVSGDFNPIVFQGHLSHEDDPIERVAWMGRQEGLTGYVCEKARSGSGREACTRWSTDDAHADLKELIAEREAELRAECEEEHGPDEADWPDDELCCSTIQAMTAGLEAFVQYDGREGVHEMLEAIRDCPHEIEMEDVYSIGVRPSNGLELAHLAVRRLHALLQAEARAESVRLAAEATAKVSEAALDLGEAVVGTSKAFETLRTRLGEPTERLRAEQREHAIEQELDPDLCPCGNPGVCVGQYEGDVRPKLGCAECCNHEDFGECGRCWPLVREAGT